MEKTPVIANGEQIEMAKQMLNEAFKSLRHRGIIARQNYKCCMSCGFSALEDEVKKRATSGKKINGVVFYHKQDNERRLDGHDIMLRYDATTDELSQEAIGKIICEEITKAGLVFQWDGKGSSCIRVIQAI